VDLAEQVFLLAVDWTVPLQLEGTPWRHCPALYVRPFELPSIDPDAVILNQTVEVVDVRVIHLLPNLLLHLLTRGPVTVADAYFRLGLDVGDIVEVAGHWRPLLSKRMSSRPWFLQVLPKSRVRVTCDMLLPFNVHLTHLRHGLAVGHRMGGVDGDQWLVRVGLLELVEFPLRLPLGDLLYLGLLTVLLQSK